MGLSPKKNNDPKVAVVANKTKVAASTRGNKGSPRIQPKKPKLAQTA